jgi:hypothetical protein
MSLIAAPTKPGKLIEEEKQRGFVLPLVRIPSESLLLRKARGYHHPRNYVLAKSAASNQFSTYTFGLFSAKSLAEKSVNKKYQNGNVIFPIATYSFRISCS